MLRAFLRTMAVTVALVAIPAVGQACEGGRVLMDDSFTKLNPAWGVSLDAKSEKIDSNGLSVSYAPGGVKRALSQWGFFDNAVACASYTVDYQCTDAEKCETQPYVGLVVWGRDLANYYTFEVAPLVGIYSVQRLQDNRWLTPVAWSKLPGGKKIASGQKFELSAVVKGNTVTFKLDDQTVAEFEALAPEGGSLVGFELAAAQDGSAKSEISLSRFEVREVGAGG
ncbi:MAG: hypothetical protein KKB66_08705 [Alphaproteobacteria bacterium]|jgi:hypothetical protein|nr:hypothetical protein [Alphaproteobacteria bacterium]MBU0802657.1 hypothetical protein [Alphaproteobacteria bacterium]MBU0871454.1 hypothetical protein [Alphaproteobacteria bacterium]MBU1400121.1 hypothetical protein [Alphaproteobacteria bacterium]MBU1591241.1 hypothetical protein [Alphaproteobacteria bacterium]